MPNEVQVFNFENDAIRTVILDGEPMFVGNDVANVLGYSQTAKAVRDHVDEEDKGVSVLDTPGGPQNVTVINESGVYSLIFGSRLNSAKRFKRWVTSDVLPTIRKTGGYQVPTTVDGQIALLATGYSNMTQKVERVAGDVDYLMNQAGLSQDQRYELEKARNRRATYLLGGHDSNAYQLVGRRMFRQMFHDFKERFQITAYGRLPRAKFEQGVAYVNAWTPDTNMRMDIEEANNQIDLNL